MSDSNDWERSLDLYSMTRGGRGSHLTSSEEDMVDFNWFDEDLIDNVIQIFRGGPADESMARLQEWLMDSDDDHEFRPTETVYIEEDEAWMSDDTYYLLASSP